MMKEGCGRHMFLCQKQPLNVLVIKGMRVNEQGRVSKIMLRIQSKVKEQCLYYYFKIHNHNVVFNIEHSSYSKMSVK